MEHILLRLTKINIFLLSKEIMQRPAYGIPKTMP